MEGREEFTVKLTSDDSADILSTEASMRVAILDNDGKYSANSS